MSESLQDQLRALGLAGSQPNPRQGEKRPSRNAGKRGAGHGGPEPSGELSLDQAYALRERDDKRREQRTRRQKLEEERHRRQVNRAIREVVNAHRQNSEDAEIARHFLFNGRIRKVYVTSEQLQALHANQLGIAYLAGRYHLLEPDALDAVRRISTEHVVDLGLETGDDDPEYPVPDDLVW